ncbi:MAG: peptidase [Spirochaetia bacterium]|nr:peptidase [Spirochaetia bacterium]
MIIKIDGIENKELASRDKLLKFLKENTHSGKVSPQVEVFKSIDVQKDSFHWVMSTFDVDRDFEKVDPAGWNLKNYLANPVILWSHDYTIPAIGYAENVKAETVLEGDIVFNDKEFDEFGWSIGQRVKCGALRCGSVGFIADEVEFLEAKDRECDLIFRKQELLEFSICCVPANPFARNDGTKRLEITEVIQEPEELSYFDRLREGLKKTIV